MRIDTVMWADAPWPQLRQEWLRADAIGVSRGWLYDHLLLNGRPIWHEAYTSLAAAAAVTTRIGVGTMVTSPNFRHPVIAAKSALTLHDVAAGRFVLGVGAGGPGGDSDALGTPPLPRSERMARLAEWVGLTRRLLDEPRVDADGTFYTARDVAIGGGANRPAIAVAATGAQGMAVAADHARLWITQDIAQNRAVYAGTGFAEIRRQLELLDEVCAERGRDPRTLERLAVLGYGDERPLASVAAFEDCVQRYAQLGITTIAVLWPRGAHADAESKVLETMAGAA